MTNSGSVHTSPRDDLCTAKNLARTLAWDSGVLCAAHAVYLKCVTALWCSAVLCIASY